MKDDRFRLITITMFVLLSVWAAIQQYQINKLTAISSNLVEISDITTKNISAIIRDVYKVKIP